MQDIHYMGAKTSKYMKHRVKEAPLLNRSSCKYSNDYCPKPLGDHAFNRELADSFKVTKELPMSEGTPWNKTSYAENFNEPRTQAHFDTAIQPNKGKEERKKMTRTLGGTDYSMEKQSHAERVHNGQRFKSSELALPKPNFMHGGTVTSDTYRTSYASDFTRSMNTTSDSAFKVFTEAKEMKSRAAKEEDRMFTTRRSCFLSPGQ